LDYYYRTNFEGTTCRYFLGAVKRIVDGRIFSLKDCGEFYKESHSLSYVFLLPEFRFFGLQKFKFNKIFTPFQKNDFFASFFTPNYLYSSDFLMLPTNFTLINFNIYNTEGLLESFDECFENLKNTKYIYFVTHKNIFLNSLKYSMPQTYISVLDAFRANYEEYSWDFDYEYSLVDSTQTKQDTLGLLPSFTNKVKLRAPAKNAIVTYNAIQKVYKSRFDDFRSNTNFGDFYNSYTAYPFLTEEKTPYESLLGKNTESFFGINFFNKYMLNNYSTYSNILSANNYPFLEIPFLLSMKSDASRYLWFD
jgi:hypothetical protein